MKKILIVTDAWQPQINGVVRVTEAHVRYLRALGYEVELIEPAQFLSVRLPFSPDIRLAIVPSRRVYRRLAAGGFDAVHITAEGPLGWAARRACRRLQIPFTSWYHTRFDVYLGVYAPFLLAPINILLRRFHRAAARTMVSTPFLQQTLKQQGFTNIVVVPLGVDAAHFVRSTTPPVFAKPVFMYLGRLAPEKSPEEFLKLKLQGTKLVVGDGPLRKSLEKKYPDAQFVGFRREQELVDYISAADVFVFPSRTETFGLVQLEAMACGVPVAAHDVMGPKDVVTVGKDGYLGEDLAEAALKCLDLSAQDCRKKAEQYSWERSTQEFIKQLSFIK